MGGWTSPSGLTKTSGIDPNAPLSTLLPSAPTPYAGTTTPGVSSTSKLQYLTDIAGTEGTKALGAGTPLLGKSLDYWQNLMKPPTRTSLLEREAPAVSSVIGQYSTGKKALAQLPRGGGATAVAANLPFQEAGAITGLLSQELKQQLDVLQPQAAQQISAIGQFIDSLGLEELGLSSAGLTSLISAGLTKRGQTLQLVSDIVTAIAGAAGKKLGGG